MPHAWILPALKEANWWLPATATGVDDVPVAPLPSWPLKFVPQQCAARETVTRPQAKLPPVAICMNCSADVPSVGTSASLVPPLPICPEPPLPQQATRPDVRRPQESSSPVCTCVKPVAL